MSKNHATQNSIEDSPRYCIFERKICRYANKENSCFTCEAQSDDEMICGR